jgi:hypothetical protein
MTDFIEWIWPRIQGARPKSELDEDRQRDLLAVRHSGWARDVDVALEQARRLYDDEAERRRSAETKATTYLALIGVLIPILATFGMTAANDTIGLAERAVGLTLLLLATVYLLRAGAWAFSALDVDKSTRVDVLDLAQLWARPMGAPQALIREILCAVRSDRDGVNNKLTAVRMTQAFLIRSAVAFTFLMIVGLIVQAIYPAPATSTPSASEATSVEPPEIAAPIPHDVSSRVEHPEPSIDITDHGSSGTSVKPASGPKYDDGRKSAKSEDGDE